MRLEAQKNKLENLLTNNLNRRKDELVQALQEISVEDRKRQLENTSGNICSMVQPSLPRSTKGKPVKPCRRH
jgi:structural maintenance of chromosome 3 (chondroitin sulfate proteoglycan 6)